jgi:hypothetical protein
VLRRRDAPVLRVVRLKEGPEAAANQPHKRKLSAFIFSSLPEGQDLPMVVLAFGRFAVIPGVGVIAHPEGNDPDTKAGRDEEDREFRWLLGLSEPASSGLPRAGER